MIYSSGARRKRLLVLVLLMVVLVAGAFWLLGGKKLLLDESAATDAATDWSSPVDQPPPAGFSYGQADPNQSPASREQVIARADEYLVDKLGEANFKRYYQRLPQRDSFAAPRDSPFDFIGYISNASRLHGYDEVQYEKPSDAVQFIQVNRTNLKEVYGIVPDCTADASQCDYRLTKQQAADIARQRGLSGELYVMIAYDNTGRHFLEVASCQDKKAVHVDYSSSRVIRVVEGCQPLVFDDLGN